MRFPVDAVQAGIAPVQQADGVEQRWISPPRFSDYHYLFAGVKTDVDVAEGLGFVPALFINPVDIFQYPVSYHITSQVLEQVCPLQRPGDVG